MKKPVEENYDDKEAQQRFEAALKGALKTPAKPLKEKRKKVDDKRPKKPAP